MQFNVCNLIFFFFTCTHVSCSLSLSWIFHNSSGKDNVQKRSCSSGGMRLLVGFLRDNFWFWKIKDDVLICPHMSFHFLFGLTSSLAQPGWFSRCIRNCFGQRSLCSKLRSIWKSRLQNTWGWICKNPVNGAH